MVALEAAAAEVVPYHRRSDAVGVQRRSSITNGELQGWRLDGGGAAAPSRGLEFPNEALVCDHLARLGYNFKGH